MAEKTNEQKVDQPRRRRSPVRWVLTLVAVVVFGLVVLGVFLPQILEGGWGRSMIAQAVSNRINGSVEFGGAELHWFSGQTFTGVNVYDADGERVGEVPALSVDASLWGLVTGSKDYGQIVLAEPNLRANVDADGRIDLLEALASAEPSDEPTSLPGTFTLLVEDATLVVRRSVLEEIDPIDRIVSDPADRVERQLPPLTIRANVTVEASAFGEPVSFDVRGQATQQDQAAAFTAAGRVSGFDEQGVLQANQLGLDGTVEVTGIDPALVDRLARAGGAFERHWNQPLDLVVEAAGSVAAEQTLTLRLSAGDRRLAAANATIDRDQLTASADLDALPPALIDALAGLEGQLSESWPRPIDATVTAQARVIDPAAMRINLTQFAARATSGEQLDIDLTGTADQGVLNVASPEGTTNRIVLPRKLADRLLAMAGVDGEQIRLTETVIVEATIDRLAAPIGPIDLDRTAADVTLTIRDLAMVLPGDAQVRWPRLTASLASPSLSGRIKLDVEGTTHYGAADGGGSSGDASGGGGGRSLEIDITAENLLSRGGEPTLDKATLSATGRVPDVPVGVIEAIAERPGQFTPHVGETATLAFDLQSRGSGRITGTVTLDTPRMEELELPLAIGENTLALSEPASTVYMLDPDAIAGARAAGNGGEAGETGGAVTVRAAAGADAMVPVRLTIDRFSMPTPSEGEPLVQPGRMVAHATIEAVEPLAVSVAGVGRRLGLPLIDVTLPTLRIALRGDSLARPTVSFNATARATDSISLGAIVLGRSFDLSGRAATTIAAADGQAQAGPVDVTLTLGPADAAPLAEAVTLKGTIGEGFDRFTLDGPTQITLAMTDRVRMVLRRVLDRPVPVAGSPRLTLALEDLGTALRGFSYDKLVARATISSQPLRLTGVQGLDGVVLENVDGTVALDGPKNTLSFDLGADADLPDAERPGVISAGGELRGWHAEGKLTPRAATGSPSVKLQRIPTAIVATFMPADFPITQMVGTPIEQLTVAPVLEGAGRPVVFDLSLEAPLLTASAHGRIVDDVVIISDSPERRAEIGLTLTRESFAAARAVIDGLDELELAKRSEPLTVTLAEVRLPLYGPGGPDAEGTPTAAAADGGNDGAGGDGDLPTIDATMDGDAADADADAGNSNGEAAGEQPRPRPLPIDPTATVVDVSLEIPELVLRDRRTDAVTTLKLSGSIDTKTNLTGQIALKLDGRASYDLPGDGGERGGPLGLSGTVSDLYDAAGRMTLDKLDADVTAKLEAVPTALIDAFGGNGYAAPALGPIASVGLDANVTDMNGTLLATLESPNLTEQVVIRGPVREGLWRVSDPVNIGLRNIEPLADKALAAAHPVLRSVTTADQPVRLRIDPTAEGGALVVPLTSFDIGRVVIGNARLELGKLAARPGPILKGLSGLLGQRLGNRTTLWFTPLEFSMKGGTLTYDRRLDLLIDGTMHVASWGTVDIARVDVPAGDDADDGEGGGRKLAVRYRLFLGLPGNTLEGFVPGVKLADDAMLVIPLEGTGADPKVDWGAVATRMAGLAVKEKHVDDLLSRIRLPGELGGISVGDVADLGQRGLEQLLLPKEIRTDIPPMSVERLPWTPEEPAEGQADGEAAADAPPAEADQAAAEDDDPPRDLEDQLKDAAEEGLRRGLEGLFR